MKNIYYLITILLFCTACGQVQQPAKVIPVEDFFRNPEKTAFQLSPDGTHISFLQPYKKRLNLYIQKIGDSQPVRITTDTVQSIARYFWGSNTQLLFLKDNAGDENYRLYTINKDGSDSRDLTPFDNTKIAIVSSRLLTQPDHILIGLNKRTPSLFDVYKLNIRTGKCDMLQENPGSVLRWILDTDEKLRLAVATDGVNQTLLYRDKETEPFRTILSTNFKENISPICFTNDNKYIYCISNLGRDKAAVVKFDPLIGKEIELIYQNTEYDVNDLIVSERTQSLYYANYIDWKLRTHFLDDTVKQFFNALYKKLPGYELTITDVDNAENSFLIRTYGDRSLGAYYLYNRSTDNLTKLSDVSPWLPEEELAKVKPIQYKSRDGLTINGYLTLPKGKDPKNLPVVIYPHGGPWTRNLWTFSPEVQFFANRGYAVLQMNYRGSTGYGRAFREAGYKQWGLKMQDDINDGAMWLVNQGIADSSRMAIYGFSFGGYVALNALVKTPQMYRCAVDYSGFTNVFTYIKEIPPYYKPFLNMAYEMVGNPETDAEYFKEVSPIFHTDKITQPLLVVHGKKDPRINMNEVNQLVKDLKKRGVDVTYILKDNEGHGFKNEENKLAFYKELEQFLAKNLQKAN